MKCNNPLTVIFAILAMSVLSGCASNGTILNSGTDEYVNDRSRAWNLTRTVGMNQLRDAEVPSDQIPSKLVAAADMGIDVFYLMGSQTLNMDFGDAFGLGLIGLLTKPDGHGERSTIVAWAPESEVEGRENVHLWLGDQIRNATIKAMDNLGIQGEAEFHNKLTDSMFNGTFVETRIKGVKADGTECGAYFKIHPENVSDEVKAIPDFIAESTSGYQVFAGDGVVYPQFQAYCLSDTTLDPYVEFIGEISKNLPETVFFYTRKAELNGKHLPPVVWDHGKALLFLTVKDDA
jgi:hypothetical protein